MSQFKIHILYDFQGGPWGGGNQFLKCLKKGFENIGVYTNEIGKANVLLFNNYPFRNESYFNEAIKFKKYNPRGIIINRIDGPISLIRNRDRDVDVVIAGFSKLFVDGIVCQSGWSKSRNKELFNLSANYETIIYNASDSDIFNANGKKAFQPSGKVRLIATSWSGNWQKGFEIYKYLDENLDFNKYEMTFVGSSPIEFKNIKWVKPVSSDILAGILKEHDIYITASQNDPCSNALIEALSCGLPAVALNSGGHPELIGGGGTLFNGNADVIGAINEVTVNYDDYVSELPKYSIENIVNSYLAFAQQIQKDMLNGNYICKKVSIGNRFIMLYLFIRIFVWKIMVWVRNKCKI